MKTMMTILLAAALAACGGKKTGDNAGSGSAMAGSGSAMAGSGSAMAGSGSAMAGSGSGSAMAGSGSAAEVDVPTATDFEGQAQTDITEKNVDQKLSAMEKELGTD